jgi:hypothetical protein
MRALFGATALAPGLCMSYLRTFGHTVALEAAAVGVSSMPATNLGDGGDAICGHPKPSSAVVVGRLGDHRSEIGRARSVASISHANSPTSPIDLGAGCPYAPFPFSINTSNQGTNGLFFDLHGTRSLAHHTSLEFVFALGWRLQCLGAA